MFPFSFSLTVKYFEKKLQSPNEVFNFLSHLFLYIKKLRIFFYPRGDCRPFLKGKLPFGAEITV